MAHVGYGRVVEVTRKDNALAFMSLHIGSHGVGLRQMFRDSLSASLRFMSPFSIALKRRRSSLERPVVSKWFTTTMVVSPPGVSR